jgi:hypothetical protein
MSGRWQKLKNAPSAGGATISVSTMLLATDGTVMCQGSGTQQWLRLTPDATGSYLNGTFSLMHPMITGRLYYASAVLKDARVIVCGGEYVAGSNTQAESNKCEIYDPVSAIWTSLAPPTGWAKIGDAACAVLPDGRFLLGNIFDQRSAIYDPHAHAWSDAGKKNSSSSEESWVLMPDDTVLTVECNTSQQAELYVPASKTWVKAGTTPSLLVEASSSEIGPAILLPDHRAFFVGATGQTALYTPGAKGAVGTWSGGPDLPKDANNAQLIAKDAPGCLLPNGRVLLALGPKVGTEINNGYGKPTSFYEFDGTAFQRTADPGNAADAPYTGRLLLLPSGEVLFSASTPEIWLYRSDEGAPNPAWAPVIDHVPGLLTIGKSFSIAGRQFNGLSQAVGYGDDAAASTNYPLVQLKNATTGQIIYCRTFDHSTMAVSTGGAATATNFDVPAGTKPGNYEIRVIANGIASAPHKVAVKAAAPIACLAEAANALRGSLAKTPDWVVGEGAAASFQDVVPADAKRGRAAYQDVAKGLATLDKIAAAAKQSAVAAAKKVPPAVDLEALGLVHDDDDKDKDKNQSKKGVAAVQRKSRR